MSTSSKARKKFGGPLITGVTLDVKDISSGKWYPAEIINSEFFKIEIKYNNFSSQYNTDWISTEKELYRIEPLGTHTTAKVDQTNDNSNSSKNNNNNNSKKNNNNNKNSDETQNDVKTEVLTDYFDESSNFDSSSNDNTMDTTNNNGNNSNNNKNKASAIIRSLESKVSSLEAKLQLALKNDATLNVKVTNLTNENGKLKNKAKRMSNEIKSLKKMLNDLKNDDIDTWEEIE